MITTLSQLVAQIESGNCAWAIRIEPGFKPSQLAIDNCIKAHKPAYMNRATAEMICRSSWGTYQIMGENLYTICKVNTPVAHFMASDVLQLKAFWSHNVAKKIDFTLDEIKRDESKRLLFARRYNGSATYAAKLQGNW